MTERVFHVNAKETVVQRGSDVIRKARNVVFTVIEMNMMVAISGLAIRTELVLVERPRRGNAPDNCTQLKINNKCPAPPKFTSQGTDMNSFPTR